jgi:hypothetical protein
MGDISTGDILFLIAGYAARTVLLTVLLCFMVKIQKLNFYFLGLLAAAAIACALDTIPYVGHYLAVPVLYLCIWKVTGASLMPDAVFTVVIAYALMFAVNVLLLTALMGDLRPSAKDDETDGPPPAVVLAKATPQPALIHTSSPPAAVSVPVATPTNSVKPQKSAEEILKAFAVKAATANGDKSLLTVSANKKIYTLTTDQPTLVPLADGVCRLRLVNVSGTWATVEVNGESAYLPIH